MLDGVVLHVLGCPALPSEKLSPPSSFYHPYFFSLSF